MKRFIKPLVAISLVCILLALFGVRAERVYGIWIIDPHDLSVYFDSSRWIIDGGRLYRDVLSEYPLMANMIFAAWRYLGNLLYPGIKGFQYIWVISAGLIFLWAVYRVATGTTLLAALAWVAPAPIYFGLFRFDIYPAVATLLALFAIRRASYIAGAVWLGVAAALKGYALFMLPAFCIFMIYQRGFGTAVYIGMLAVAPMILTLFVTLMFAGWEGLLAPLEYHMQRGFNGESTYDAINYFLGTQLSLNQMPLVPQSLQLASALVAAAMRPKTFGDLVNAFLFAVLGFMTFSVFYSPQFVLWVLPIVCFSHSRVMVIAAIIFSWLTFLYFPIVYHLAYGSALFGALVVAVTLLRLFMMLLTIVYSNARVRRIWFPAASRSMVR
jgi:hypothetical protein